MQMATEMAIPARPIRTQTATACPTSRTTARTLPPLTSLIRTATVSATRVTSLPPEESREPEPVPELGSQGDAGETEPPAPKNGENQDGRRNRACLVVLGQGCEIGPKSREPIITTGVVLQEEGIGGPPVQEEPPAEEPVRDNPRINEELIAEAAASGELDAPPEPPPAPQRAWDEEAVADSTEWDSIVKIDAGAAGDAESSAARLADDELNDGDWGTTKQETGDLTSRDQADTDVEVQDSRIARGWVRAKLLLQEELQGEESTEEPAGDGEPGNGPAGDRGDLNGSSPVPVESGW